MFPSMLKKLRKASGYKSQQTFANAFGVAQSTVGMWEAGKREPNYETTIRLAKFLNVSIDCLLGYEHEATQILGKEVSEMATEEEVIAKINDDKPELILASIPEDKLRSIPNKICELLINNGLSFQQAEMLLAVAKSRLRKAKI